MKNLKQKTLAVSTAAILGLGAAGSAHAGGAAFSSLIIDNFIIRDSSGDQLDLTDFASITVSDTADNSATLNSALGPAASDSRSADANDTVLGVADPSLTCVGAGGAGTGDCVGIGPNDFTEQPTIPTSLQQFSRADTLLEGAVITGAGATDVNGNPLDFARVSHVAEVQINELTGVGSSDSSASNGTQFQFSLSDLNTFSFAFDATSDLHLYMGQPDVAAKGNRTFTISIKDDANNILFSWSPNGASGGISGGGGTSATELADSFDLNFPSSLLNLGEEGPTHLTGDFAATVGNLPTNELLTFSIASSVGASVELTTTPTTVPEPATLALLGAGLLGMGAASRPRRRRKV